MAGKFRTSKKFIMESFDDVIAVGYCKLQHLLEYKQPIAYTTNRDGWRADIYEFGDTAIATGYGPFGNKNPDYETVRKYDEAAEGKTPEERDKLIEEFIGEVCGYVIPLF